jgi:hypothetical protein
MFIKVFLAKGPWFFPQDIIFGAPFFQWKPFRNSGMTAQELRVSFEVAGMMGTGFRESMARSFSFQVSEL